MLKENIKIVFLKKSNVLIIISILLIIGGIGLLIIFGNEDRFRLADIMLIIGMTLFINIKIKRPSLE
ncbi:hypothetical protein CUR39_09965 [Latilactobacillus sakei]|nr:hypothetical protein B4V05_02940 [Latilactobacillus sakei]PKX60380.1 hypothetical protein CUR39_09965 [Latilactobacillus sakei]PKX69246.1 hypothetical protein CUR36_09470 [Latilactobacillus sakei]RFN55745.1 hypothetical protein DT321_09730 [Latilactobacillus sakei]USG04565.1 hypothetical protein A4W87_06735 [Latilactobacillus sakei]